MNKMLIPDDYDDMKKSILRALAEQVEALNPQHTVDQLAGNPTLLHSYVSKMRINWQSIAHKLGASRASIYHWYNETHLRRISGVKMTADDKQLIKNIIVTGINTGQILEEGFHLIVRSAFTNKYSRQEIMMSYNNILRSKAVQRLLKIKNITLASRRSNAKYDIEPGGDTLQESTDKDISRAPTSAFARAQPSISVNTLGKLENAIIPLSSKVSELPTIQASVSLPSFVQHTKTGQSQVINTAFESAPLVFYLLSPSQGQQFLGTAPQMTLGYYFPFANASSPTLSFSPPDHMTPQIQANQ